MKKIIIIIAISFAFIGLVILKTSSLGYNLDYTIYDKDSGSQTVSLGVPKLSFMKKENDKSYSYKNIRSNKTLIKEIKSFLKTLNRLECNNTIHYYDKENDFTIIDYAVKNKFLYNSISYEIRYGNYCNSIKQSEYALKLGGLKRYHTLNGGKISLNENWNSKFEVLFLDDYDVSLKNYEFTANLKVYLYKRKSDKEFYTYILENSIGNFEIKDDELSYYRTDILEKSDDIKIPKVSVFKIKDKNLILADNYLSKYEKEIILK